MVYLVFLWILNVIGLRGCIIADFFFVGRGWWEGTYARVGVAVWFVVLLDGRWQGVCCPAPGLRRGLASKPLKIC